MRRRKRWQRGSGLGWLRHRHPSSKTASNRQSSQ